MKYSNTTRPLQRPGAGKSVMMTLQPGRNEWDSPGSTWISVWQTRPECGSERQVWLVGWWAVWLVGGSGDRLAVWVVGWWVWSVGHLVVCSFAWLLGWQHDWAEIQRPGPWTNALPLWNGTRCAIYFISSSQYSASVVVVVFFKPLWRRGRLKQGERSTLAILIS